MSAFVFRVRLVWVGLLACALAWPVAVAADEAETLSTLRQRIEQLEATDRAREAQLRQLQSQLDDQWLDERREQEIRAMVKEVLADADTRSSLLAQGAMAGIDDRGRIYLRSADEAFLMNITGQIQFRYLFDYQSDSDPVSARGQSTESGFQMRRAKIQFAGHIADPKIIYVFRLAHARGSGNTTLEEARIGYNFDNGMFIHAGKMKLPLQREWLISSTRLMTVERSSVHDYFTGGFADQVQLGWRGEQLRLVAAISDGINTNSSDFNTGRAEVAVTGRADLRLLGEWSQADQYTSPRDAPQALFVGVAGHYEQLDERNTAGGFGGTYTAGTVDALYQVHGLSLFAAYTMGFLNDDAALAGSLGSNLFAHGVVAQAGYRLNTQWEPFVRYEWLDADDDDELAIAGNQRDAAQILTLGTNYYLRGHSAKFTGDVVYVFAGDAPVANPMGNNPFGTGLGFSNFTTAEADPNFLLRLQFQLLF